jgi:hypothetical protein
MCFAFCYRTSACLHRSFAFCNRTSACLHRTFASSGLQNTTRNAQLPGEIDREGEEGGEREGENEERRKGGGNAIAVRTTRSRLLELASFLSSARTFWGTQRETREATCAKKESSRQNHPSKITSCANAQGQLAWDFQKFLRTQILAQPQKRD